jgi:hypothetical protein
VERREGPRGGQGVERVERIATSRSGADAETETKAKRNGNGNVKAWREASESQV